MKTYFLVAVVVAGVTEWLKNFLPEKVKDNNGAMAGIAGALSVIGALGYQFLNKAIDPNVVLTWQSVTAFTVAVVGLVQMSYNLLVQTFKAVKTKLTTGTVVDPEEAADEIADKILDGIASGLEAVSTETKVEDKSKTKKS